MSSFVSTFVCKPSLKIAFSIQDRTTEEVGIMQYVFIILWTFDFFLSFWRTKNKNVKIKMQKISKRQGINNCILLFYDGFTVTAVKVFIEKKKTNLRCSLEYDIVGTCTTGL